jgi:putative DNA primase/helicase
MENKKDGVYVPSTPGANLGHGLSPEFLAWIGKHGVKSGCNRNGNGKPPEFSEDFERPDFLDNYECTELDAGMVGDTFHVVPEACPLCGGENPRGATVPSAKAKFMFGDGWWSFKCHACGANKEELHKKFDQYDGEIFALGYDWADDIEAADAGGSMEETAATKTLDPSSFLNDDLDEDDKQEVVEAKRTTTVMAFALTDLGNGERFQWRYGHEFAWTKATGWVHYKDGCWHRDSGKEAEQAMHNVVRKIAEEAEFYDSEEMQDAVVGWAKKSESHSKIEAGLACASALLAKDYDDYDQTPHLLNCSNGTLDMATGEFRKHDPGDLLTKISPVAYDPAAKCPKWEKFVSEVMGGNEQLAGFLKRAMGYTLTDETGDHAGFMPYGVGGTGKSTALNVLKGVLGDYANTADAEMFMAKRGDSGQPFDLAGLEGTRALLAVETEENKHMAVAKFKRMTGGDPIRACYKHRDFYEFMPCWKIWLATNSRPHANAGDDAYWERIKVIPFTVKFRGTDKQVKDLAEILLAEEAPGILNWFLDGYCEWKQVGLKAPDEVKVAVSEWQEAEDWLRRFLDEMVDTTTDKNQFVLKSELFSRFDQWANRTK